MRAGILSAEPCSTRRISGQLSRLQASHLGIGGRAAGFFLPYVAHGERHLRWIDAELASATRLANAASQVDDPDMQLALLRLAGPRLEAAMLGSILLAGWLDFLNLVDIVLKQGFNSLETLFVHLDRWQKMLEPAMTALSSLEPGQVEAAAKDLPALMGHLSGEFNSTAETIRVAMKRGEQTMLLAQLVEMVTLVSALKISLPRLPPSAPATLGVGLVEWFEKRGFTGEMSIDRFCVKMERAHHEAIHGGGDWRLGRMWPGEWNQMIMEALRDAEMLAGRMLTRNEILERVAFYMKRYNIPMNFTPWRGR